MTWVCIYCALCVLSMPLHVLRDFSCFACLCIYCMPLHVLHDFAYFAWLCMFCMNLHILRDFAYFAWVGVFCVSLRLLHAMFPCFAQCFYFWSAMQIHADRLANRKFFCGQCRVPIIIKCPGHSRRCSSTSVTIFSNIPLLSMVRVFEVPIFIARGFALQGCHWIRPRVLCCSSCLMRHFGL